MGSSRRSPRRIITPTGSDITDRDQTGRRRRRRMAGDRKFDFKRRTTQRRRPEPKKKGGFFVPDDEAKRERLRRRRERLRRERRIGKIDPERERKRRAIKPKPRGGGPFTMNFAPGTPIEVKEAAYEKFAPKPFVGQVIRRENPNPRPRI